MQRKKHILKRAKNAFAMISAIIVIVIIATIMGLSLRLTTQTTKKTTDLYIHEQAILLAHSATEYALLRISQAPPCSIANINFIQDNYYDINISLRYIYTSDVICTNGANIYTIVTTPEQNGSVLMDVSVSVNDPSIDSEQIRFFKRTMQKL